MRRALRASNWQRTAINNLMMAASLITIAIGSLTVQAQNETRQAAKPKAERQRIGQAKTGQSLANPQTTSATTSPSSPGAVFTNTTPITIDDVTTATPYPSTINVSGLSGTIPTTAGSVKVTINGYSHTFSDDTAIVLVGPTGAALLIQDGVTDDAISNVTYTISDTGATQLPDVNTFTAGTYKPTAYYMNDDFPAPGPGTTYGNPGPADAGTATFSSVFGGTAPNGAWNLYITDNDIGDTGTISGGWSLEITTGVTPPARTRFDYDGDGRADVSVFRPSSGVWYLNRSTQGFSAAQFGQSGDAIAPGDFDGDGKTDLAVFRSATGVWYRLNSATNTVSTTAFGQSGDVARPGDFDGDGRADIAVFRPSSGVWYRLNSSNGAFAATAFGQSGDVPVVGDFDGDQKTDLTVFRPSTGAWYRLSSNGGAVVTTQFGQSGDVPVAADYDGDTRADIAVFRPATGVWYRLNSNGGGFVATQFGQSGDAPVAADYDGDAKADIAVFRPSNGTWYRLSSNGGAVVTTQFGQSGDVATPNAFNQ